MATKMQPLGDIVLVKPAKREEMTKSGLVLPDTAKEKPQEGEVVAVGPGRLAENGQRVSMGLDPGDIVIYSKYGGIEVEIDGVDMLLLHEGDIFAKKLK